MKRFLLIIACLFCYTFAWAQSSNISYANQAWLSCYPQFRFSERWGLWTDFETQQKLPDWNNSQMVFRIGGTYYLNDNTKLTAGYAFINYAPATGHQHIDEPENDAWQQIQLYSFIKKKKIKQWLRLEERFKRNVVDDYTLADNSTYTWRARYNIALQIPLSTKGVTLDQFAIAVGDELFYNFGKNVMANYFDQNRAFLGLSYQLNHNDNITAGYMNLFQQQPGGTQYKMYNVLRVSLFKTFNFWKKPGSPKS